jgi:hypothetical protein
LFYEAIRWNQKDLVQLLIAKKADPNEKDIYGNSAIKLGN